MEATGEQGVCFVWQVVCIFCLLVLMMVCVCVCVCYARLSVCTVVCLCVHTAGTDGGGDFFLACEGWAYSRRSILRLYFFSSFF